MNCLMLILLLMSVTSCALGKYSCTKNVFSIKCVTLDESNTLQRGVVSDNEEIQYVSLADCRITMINYESFQRMTSLQIIDLSRNYLPTLMLGVMDGLNSLQTLNLSSNVITSLPLGLFDQMTGLKTLDLSNNQLQILNLGIFDPFRNLNNLILSRNGLKQFPLGILDKAILLVNLDLSYNDMSALQLGILDRLVKLQRLNMESSRFSTMPSGIFDRSVELEELILSKNGINEIPNKQFDNNVKLKKLDLSHNALTALQHDIYDKLTLLRVLNLSFNNLTDMNGFSSLQQLEELDLSRNVIKYMSLPDMPALKHMDLTDNLITNYGSNIGQNFPNVLTKFFLHNNPWQCACLQQLLDVLRKNSIQFLTGDSFDGNRPVCVVTDNCYIDSSKDLEVYEAYIVALSAYFVKS